MTFKTSVGPTLVALLLLVASLGSSHDIWLFPEVFSVSSGDGRNPSPLGEDKVVVLWSRASLQARSAHENGPESAHRLGTEIS